MGVNFNSGQLNSLLQIQFASVRFDVTHNAWKFYQWIYDSCISRPYPGILPFQPRGPPPKISRFLLWGQTTVSPGSPFHMISTPLRSLIFDAFSKSLYIIPWYQTNEEKRQNRRNLIWGRGREIIKFILRKDCLRWGKCRLAEEGTHDTGSLYWCITNMQRVIWKRKMK